MQMRLSKTRVLQWCVEHTSGTEFWFIAVATLLFNLGISIYFFLYSLFLLDLGYTERTVGVFTSAMVLGGMAGTIPMGIIARRFGLKRVLAAQYICDAWRESLLDVVSGPGALVFSDWCRHGWLDGVSVSRSGKCGS